MKIEEKISRPKRTKMHYTAGPILSRYATVYYGAAFRKLKFMIKDNKLEAHGQFVLAKRLRFFDRTVELPLIVRGNDGKFSVEKRWVRLRLELPLWTLKTEGWHAETLRGKYPASVFDVMGSAGLKDSYLLNGDMLATAFIGAYGDIDRAVIRLGKKVAAITPGARDADAEAA